MTFGNKAEIEELAQRIKEDSLIHQQSFLNGKQLWTRENFQELYEAYNLRLEEGSGRFDEKLRSQLRGISSDARQLFAELYILNLLPLGNLRPETKTNNVNNVLKACQPRVELTDEVIEAFQGGVFNGGQGYSNYRWGHLAFAIELGRKFSAMSLEERTACLSETGLLEETIFDLVKESRGKGVTTFQKALAYLLDPENFVPIVSPDHLKQIVQHFHVYLAEDEKQLLPQRQAEIIRKRVAEERHIPDWDFYNDPEEWKAPTLTPTKDSTQPSMDGEDAPAQLTFPAGAADDLLVPERWLQRFITVLSTRRQLILQGPPGTGKTYLARRMARILAGAEDRVKLVQFHPAYTYEDFFEGFRPTLDKTTGTVQLTLRKGPLRSLAEKASEDPGQNYFLIIDEINRGNLARIFGELYFLLEYRDHAVDLMYSQDEFSLPANLYIIGTMNTADRSIALVDSAMRRRFAFLNLHPDEEPTTGVLSRWADKHNLKGSALLAWEELNRKIAHHDHKIGPSYFMRADAFTEDGLAEIWQSEIIPLLEEQNYGEQARVQDRYSLEKILDDARNQH